MRRSARLLVSFAAALAVTGALTAVAINTYFKRPRLSQVVAFEVEQAGPELLEQLRAQEAGETQAEPPQPPPRQHDGIVQLQFDVLPDGRPANIKVVGATPAGYYEDQARAQISRRRFLPKRDGGMAVTSTRTEIVEFKFVPETPER